MCTIFTVSTIFLIPVLIKSLKFLWSDLTVVLRICHFLGGVERQIFQAYLTVDSLAFVLL